MWLTKISQGTIEGQLGTLPDDRDLIRDQLKVDQGWGFDLSLAESKVVTAVFSSVIHVRLELIAKEAEPVV